MSPFKFRGLEQHGSTIDLLREDVLAVQGTVLDRAAVLGLNRVYMGERWPDLGVRLVDYRESFPELVTEERTQDAAKRRNVFEKICAHALRVGIEPWVNLNIVDYPDHFTKLFPDAMATPPATADRWMKSGGARGLSKQPQLCPSSPSFKKLIEAQLTDLCRLPHIGGIECWLTAADCDLFYCNCDICQKKTISDVIVEFSEYAHPVCVKHHKKFLLRCYLGGWRCGLEADVWPDVAARIDPAIEIAYKQQNGDLMNWHGPNALAGQLLPHQEHVEFDLAGEYRGTNYGIVCTVRWQMQELIRHFLNLGVTGVVCRGVDAVHAFDLDKWVFAALIENPDLDIETWCHEWAAKRYGHGGDDILAILDDAAEIIQLSMYVRGVQWASWAVPQNLSRLRFILFDRCAPCVPGSYERLQPTPENIQKIIEEKWFALSKADELVERCGQLKGKLDDTFFNPLFASVSYLRAYVSIAGPLMESFFRFYAWSQSFSEVTREYVRIPLVISLEAGKKRLVEIEEELKQIDVSLLPSLTSQAGFVDPKALDKFQEPFKYAGIILKEIEEQIAGESASWWAYYPERHRWPKQLQSSQELYRDTLQQKD